MIIYLLQFWTRLESTDRMRELESGMRSENLDSMELDLLGIRKYTSDGTALDPGPV